MQKIFEQFLDALWPQRCLGCEQVLSDGYFCLACESSIEPLDSEAFFRFNGAIQKVIQQAKFLPSETKARRLMNYVAQKISPEFTFSKGEIQAITFVPVHWRRRLTRGFDLSALFALTLSKQLGVPIFDALKNTRFDKPLTLAQSKQERFQLTQRRYRLRRQAAPKKILLIDDVTTTGATLKSAREVLESAGHQVQLFTLAKT